MNLKNIGNKKILIVCFSLLICTILLSAGILLAIKNSKTESRLIAVIGKTNIYENDIKDRFLSISNGYDISLESVSQNIIKSMVLEAALNKKIDRDAKKLGYDKDEKIKELTKKYKDGLVRTKFLNEKVFIDIDENKAKAEYSNVINNLKGKEERKIRHILVNSEDDIIRIRKALLRGDSFEKIAINQSIDKSSAVNGGDLGYLLKEDLVPEFGDIAFILKINTISKPIKTDYGWHIIEVKDIRPAKFSEYDDIRNDLIESLKQKAMQDYLKSFVDSNKVNMIINLENQNEEEQNNKITSTETEV